MADQRAGVAVGAEAHVDAEHEAVGRHFRQRRDQLPAEPREVFGVGDRADRRRRRDAIGPVDAVRDPGLAILGVDEDQVDIGRDVEFAGAELAHPDHQQVLRRTVDPGARHAVDRGQRTGVEGQRLADRDFGQRRCRPHDLGDLGAPVEVAVDQRGEDDRADLAEAGAQMGFVAPSVAATGRDQRVDLNALDPRLGEPLDARGPGRGARPRAASASATAKARNGRGKPQADRSWGARPRRPARPRR